MPRTKRHIARSIAYAGGFLAAASCSAWFWLEHDRLQTRQTELASTVLRLERLTGYVGFIHQVLYDEYLKDHPAPEDVEYYICGPPMMNAAVFKLLEQISARRSSIQYT